MRGRRGKGHARAWLGARSACGAGRSTRGERGRAASMRGSKARGLARLVKTWANACVQRLLELRRRWIEAYTRAGVTEGYRIVTRQWPGELGEMDSCVCCGKPASARAKLSRDAVVVALWMRVPKLDLPVCTACGDCVRRRALCHAGRTAAGLVSIILVMGVASQVWPWLGLGRFALVGACASMAFALVLFLHRVRGGAWDGAWFGIPGRWLREQGGQIVAAITCPRLATSLGEATGTRPERAIICRGGSSEILGATLFVVGIVSPGVWVVTHPPVRTVNVGDVPVVVVVDGHILGIVPGIPGEAPEGGHLIRVPMGRRFFEARALDGSVVDATDGMVSRPGEMLYAPNHGARCFWVEELAYGVQPKRSTRRIDLVSRGGFYSVPGQIDAWFQPNPRGGNGDQWFAGGVRRTVRQGPCSRKQGT